MPIKLEYDRAHNILKIHAYGTITLDNVEQGMKQVFESSEYPSDINTLWDVRQLDFSELDLDLIKGIVLLRKKYDAERDGAKIAILSNYALAGPLVKLYTILTRGLRQSNKVFTTEDSAMLWLLKEFH